MTITPEERAALRDGYQPPKEVVNRLLDALEAAERERDEAQAIIAAATSDVRPESFLDHAQAILAKCVAPYSCEQMKAVGDALAGGYRKWELALEVAMKACGERDALRRECERLCVHGAEPTSEEWAALRKERDALKAKLADPRRVLIHETEVVATKDEIAALKAKLASCDAIASEMESSIGRGVSRRTVAKRIRAALAAAKEPTP